MRENKRKKNQRYPLPIDNYRIQELSQVLQKYKSGKARLDDQLKLLQYAHK